MFTLAFQASHLSVRAFPSLGRLRKPPGRCIDHVATLIENSSISPADKAANIAGSLRDAAAAASSTGWQNPRDLAAALTTRLHPLDHHFRVTWTPPEDSARSHPAAEDSGPPQSFDALARSEAYGFRQVEMLPGAIGYLDITTFADFSFSNPQAPARKAADAALALVSTADAIVIDLRHNGGGSPNMVGYLVSAFTPPGAELYNTFHQRRGHGRQRTPQGVLSQPAP